MDMLHPHFPSPLGNRQVHQNKIHRCSLQPQNKQRWLASLRDETGDQNNGILHPNRKPCWKYSPGIKIPHTQSASLLFESSSPCGGFNEHRMQHPGGCSAAHSTKHALQRPFPSPQHYVYHAKCFRLFSPYLDICSLGLSITTL